MAIDASELRYEIHQHVIPAALDQLPSKMDTPEARAMLLAIGMQESRFKWREQIGGGPAHGFWQFERGGGVRGVLRHPVTKPIIDPVLELFGYHDTDPLVRERVCYALICHNDIIACVFARLLLWTVPGKLAQQHEPARGWRQYLDAWRPGKPHPATWHDCFAEAWRLTIDE